jgi:Domain of unknown function (DUF4386)
MESPRRTAGLVAFLLLVQLAGLIVPFVLLHPMIPADFVERAAASSPQVRTAVFLLFGNCALTIGLSIAVWPLFRRHDEGLALLLVAVSAIMFSLQAVDNAHLLSMLALSQQYVDEGARGDVVRAMAMAVRSTRRWVHYSELLSIEAWILVFYSVLYRAALVPRALSVFGLTTVILHFTGIVLPVFLGYSSVIALGMPLGLSHLGLALWLAIKGFDDPRVAPDKNVLGNRGLS